MFGTPAPHPPSPGTGLLKRGLVAAVAIVLLAALATATAGLLQTKEIIQALGGSPSIPGHVDPVPAGAPQTILILGSDKRFGPAAEGRRSDTMMLVRLNPDADAVALMSVPRDLVVDIPGHGQDKINAAYSVGGAALATKVVRETLTSATGERFRIHHIVDINFSLFQRLVNRLGCVYTDIDRYYYHASTGRLGDYSAIDLSPGYQRLCGSDALAFVRYRHNDNDIVRAARQQNFMGDAKAQYGPSLLINKRKSLATLFGRYTRSDHALKTESGFIKLLALLIDLGGKPTVQVKFPAVLPADPKGPVTLDAALLVDQVHRFLDVKSGASAAPSSKPPPTRRTGRGKSRRAARDTGVPGLVPAASAGETQGVQLGAGPGLTIYYPKLVPSTASYEGPLAQGRVYPRAYSIKTTEGRPRWPSYRFVLNLHRGLGNYVGVQGTTWPNPPILRSPDKIVRVNRKRLQVYYDGGKVRIVAWKTSRGIYWIVNSLEKTLTGRQMMAMAGSFTRLGSN